MESVMLTAKIVVIYGVEIFVVVAMAGATAVVGLYRIMQRWAGESRRPDEVAPETCPVAP
jgi:hypothetical protein